MTLRVRPSVGWLFGRFFLSLSKKVFVVFVFKIPNYQDKRAKCLSLKCLVYPCSQLWRRTRRRGVKITSRRLKGQLRLLFDTWITTDISTMTYSKTHHVFRYLHFNPNLPQKNGYSLRNRPTVDIRCNPMTRKNLTKLSL